VNASLHGKTFELIQWEYCSLIEYSDPFNEIELDILITSPSNETWIIPTFWMGEQKWGARFIAKDAGVYQISTRCSDSTNKILHNTKHQLHIKWGSHTPQAPNLKVSKNKLYLQDSKDKAFLWLADTWWMALSKRLSYPNDFTSLAQQRKMQEFNVILLVAGLFPDMDSFDERGSNKAGFPWEKEYARINPHYFDEADKRISYLINEGFVLCVLGSWGYYLQHMGEDKMKQHWRYIIARWGAYSIVWCIAGEATMPYYLSKQRTEDMYTLHEGWTRLAHYIKTIEPFGNLLTIHPTEIGRDQIQEPSLLDFNLIQSGHNDYSSVQNTIKLVKHELHREPVMPTIIGETNYEGILHNSPSSIQRLSFWTAILSGAKGYSYGANGVWQVNTKEKPFGDSPHGDSWGDVPWEESYLYEGATQLGYAKQFLENYPWWLLEPHQEWISPQGNLFDYKHPRVAGISAKLRIIYFYTSSYHWWNHPKYTLVNLENDIIYESFFWNPQTNIKHSLGHITSTPKGHWKIPKLPSQEDWILLLQSI